MKSKYDDLIGKIDLLLCTLEVLTDEDPDAVQYARTVIGGQVDLLMDATHGLDIDRHGLIYFMLKCFEMCIVRGRCARGEPVDPALIKRVMDNLEDFKKWVKEQ